jgi:hypothetical protein
MSAETWLILAAAGQAAIVAVSFGLLARGRIGAYRAREYRMRDIATDRSRYPARLHKLQNNVANQFETPVMFLAAIAIALAAGLAGPTLAVLAWAWLAARVVHMGVHVGPNVVRWRFYAFGVSCLVLLAMWVVLVVAALRG